MPLPPSFRIDAVASGIQSVRNELMNSGHFYCAYWIPDAGSA